MIETERLILRNFKETDIDDYFECVSQEDVLSRMGGATPYSSKEKALERLVYESKQLLHFAIVLKENNKVIGNISLNEPKLERYTDIKIDKHTKELGYFLSHDYWGKGIMPEAGVGLLKYAFSKLGVTKIVCGTKTLNNQSIRVQEKIGLKMHSIKENAGTWINGESCDYIRTFITSKEWLKNYLETQKEK